MSWLDLRRFAGPAAAGALLLAGCGGKAQPHASSSLEPHPDATTAAPTVSTAATTGAVSTRVAAPSTTTSRPKAPAGSRQPLAAPTTSLVPTAGAKPSPIAPGTYGYRQSGSFAVGGSGSQYPPDGVLVVDQPGAGGVQQTHRVVDPHTGTDSTLAFHPDGEFLLTQVVRAGTSSQSQQFTCKFSPPMATPPWPVAVGETYGGHGECDNFTADITGRVTDTRSVPLDGGSVKAFILDLVITTHGQVESTATESDWWAPATGLLVHSEYHQQGRYGLFSYSQDLTSDLQSARPR